MASLVANYSDSESEQEDEPEDAEKTNKQSNAEETNSNNGTSSEKSAPKNINFLTAEMSDSEEEEEEEEDEDEVEDKAVKMPLPSFSANVMQGGDIPSVFQNPFQKADDQRKAILEQHVKMTTSLQEKELEKKKRLPCFQFKKGRCRAGDKCRFYHDKNTIVQKTEEGEKQTVYAATPKLTQPKPQFQFPDEFVDQQVQGHQENHGGHQGGQQSHPPVNHQAHHLGGHQLIQNEVNHQGRQGSQVNQVIQNEVEPQGGHQVNPQGGHPGSQKEDLLRLTPTPTPARQQQDLSGQGIQGRLFGLAMAPQPPPAHGPPSQGPPSQGHPSHGHPSHGPPSHGTPGHGSSGHGPPGHGPPGHGPPGHGAPGHGAPGRGPLGYGPPGSGQGHPLDDDNDSNQIRKRRVGLAANLVPPKRAMSNLNKQRQEERPWTMGT